MPELPDVTVYVEALERHVGGKVLVGTRLKSPFLVRTYRPKLDEAHGLVVTGVRRIGKRIALGFDGDLFLVLHLMIAGRLRWREAGAKFPGRAGLLALDFEDGTVMLTEAGTKRRASLHMVQGEAGLAEHDRGGLDVFAATEEAFDERLRAENHTLKRSLCDPRIFDGIGNAYSDEILHRAGLSPLKLSQRLSAEESTRLFEAARTVLAEWTDRLRQEVGEGFPDKVTAFRKGMAVHGRFGEPCPVCEAPVQRIVYASNETNYCAKCQTNGKLLADRALSRLLKDDWPDQL